MADYRIKILGELHELDKLTLKEARLLREHFDVRDISKINPGDPAVIAGMAYLCFRRAHPEWEHQRLMNYVDELTLDDFDTPDPDPTPVEGEVPKAAAVDGG